MVTILFSSNKIASSTCIVFILSSPRFFCSIIAFLRIRSVCFLKSIPSLSIFTRLSLFMMLLSITTRKSFGSIPKPFNVLIAAPPPSRNIPKNKCSTPILSSPNLITSSLT